MHRTSFIAPFLVCLFVSSQAFGQASLQRPGSLTLTPSGPVQGEEVEVAYEAPAWLGPQEEVVLRARLRSPDDRAYGWGADDRTLTRLQREDDGVYRGVFVYPDSAAFALLAVATPGGDAVDTNLRRGWVLLAHDVAGRATPDAYIQYLHDLTGRNFREGARVAQEFVDAFPDAPRSWNFLWFFEDQLGGSAGAERAGADRLARIASSTRRCQGTPTLTRRRSLESSFSRQGRTTRSPSGGRTGS